VAGRRARAALDDNAVALAAAGHDPAALGLATLQPGESMSAQMTIFLERTP
jgi:hypothetical protein